MRSRDLTLSAVEGTPERIPFNPFIMHFAAAIDGIDYSNEYCKDALVLANAQIKCANKFGIDHVCVSTDSYREASAWGVEVDFSGHTPVPKTHLLIGEFESIETPDIGSAPRAQDRVNDVRLLKEKVGYDQCIVGWIEAPFAEICCLFGMMDVLKLARNSYWSKIINGFINRILPIQLEFAKMQIEAGADIIGVGDSAVSQIGPKRYESACLESTHKLFQDITKHVPVLYHVCGDSSVIDKDGRDMLELVTASGTSILDIDFQVDMNTAKNKLSGRVCIRGNTNTSLLASPTYSEDQVINEITKTIEAGKPGGRYMFAAGCEWPWEPLDLSIRNLEIARSLVDKRGVY
ncbi:MAG: uroporphyrinogen decarboxylase family protein [Candidatus Thorarchaeota archaeon]|nr:uroporphyrinogen decarboxylase family protein [Candidatus Thorarchaeota archaeon]